MGKFNMCSHKLDATLVCIIALTASSILVHGQSQSKKSKHFAPDLFANHLPGLSGTLHRLMSANELQHHFGTSDSGKVPDDYRVVVIQEFAVRTGARANDDDGRRNNEVGEDDSSEAGAVRPSFYPGTRRIVIDVPKSSRKSSPSDEVRSRDVERLSLELNRNPWLVPKGSGENHCHYIYQGEDFTASASICTPNEIIGLIVQPDRIVQFHPVSHRLRKTLKATNEKLLESFNGVPHIVRAVSFDDLFGESPKNESWCGVREDYKMPAGGDRREKLKSLLTQRNQQQDDGAVRRQLGGPYQSAVESLSRQGSPDEIFQIVQKRAAPVVLNVEVGLFVDAQAHGVFQSYFGDSAKEDAFYYAYMNAVQSIFHEAGLWKDIQIRFQVVNVKKLSTEPFQMAKAAGERSEMLKAFCQFSATFNKGGDDDPNHWDISLLITGQNMWALEKGKTSYVTMGLAYVGGACYEKANCVVAELGVTTETGKPYPAAGLLAAYVGAHEIAHNLGVRHDSSHTGCPQDGFLMSPSKGFTGEQKWSTCSKKQLQEALSQGKLKCIEEAKQSGKSRIDADEQFTDPADEPGQQYDHTDQCRLFLKDADAHKDAKQKLEDICQGLYCESPYRVGKYLAGSAIDGSFCGKDKVCHDGDCVPMTAEEKAALKVVPGHESNQMRTGCTSKCLEGGMGASETKTVCEGRKNTLDGCSQDLKIVVKLCDDGPICKVRQSPKAYATELCAKFAKYAPADLSATNAEGFQHMGYDPEKPWESCAVFCKTKYNYEKAFIQDLNDLWEIPKRFPDGTLCHNDGSSKYYCMAGECRKSDPKNPEEFDSSVSYLKKILRNVEETALPDGSAPANGISEIFRKDFSGKATDVIKQHEGTAKARTGTEFPDDDTVDGNFV